MNAIKTYKMCLFLLRQRLNCWTLRTTEVKKYWICRGLNPGPFACKANVIPLHYTPNSIHLAYLLSFLHFSLLYWTTYLLISPDTFGNAPGVPIQKFLFNIYPFLTLLNNRMGFWGSVILLESIFMESI